MHMPAIVGLAQVAETRNPSGFVELFRAGWTFPSTLRWRNELEKVFVAVVLKIFVPGIRYQFSCFASCCEKKIGFNSDFPAN